MKNKLYTYIILILLTVNYSYAQQISVKLGNIVLEETDIFSITLTINNGKLISYNNFPNINGFIKSNTISNANSNQLVKPLIVTQQYIPIKAGKYKINDFVMTVNGIIFPVKGSDITVNASKKSVAEVSKVENVDVIKYKISDEYWSFRDPFLILNSSKNNIYVGEGFKISLLFCIPEGTKTSLKFHELGEQLSEIIKKIKPENCSQVAMTIDSVQQGTITKNGKKITYFKLYETVFYPLNNKKIEFSSLNIKLLNKKTNFKEEELSTNLISFSSKSLIINVKKLPFHPLRDILPVGNFILDEKISTNKTKVGKCINYNFSVLSESNIKNLPKPIWNNSLNFELFEPEISETTIKINDIDYSKISFNYFIIPHEPGLFNLGKYFTFIYFNIEREKYDTLKSKIQIQVNGESKHNLGVSLNVGDNFYDLINSENNFFENKNNKAVYILLVKVFVGILILLLLVLVWRR